MANKQGQKQESRLEIPYFDGVNTLVGDSISKKSELSHCENVRSNTIGFIEKRQGYRRIGNEISNLTANHGIAYFRDVDTGSNTGLYKVATADGTTSVYYQNTSAIWTALAGAGTGFSALDVDMDIAEKNLFIVNGTDANRYVGSDGTTVTTSATAGGHLYNSPIANKIRYYKDRMYVANYKVGATQYPTSIMMSSYPLGILALVENDASSGATTLEVSDTKYIHSSDTLLVYRGGTLIDTLTVTAKTETSITVNATSADIESADELWVNGSYTGNRLFRWADNPQSGIDVKQYDTFKLPSGNGGSITMFETVGDVLAIGTKDNIGFWDNYNLTMSDVNIGCASDRGYAKCKGTLFFLGYDGLYALNGPQIPKLVSAKVQKYFDGATLAGIESGAVGANKYSIFVSIGDVTLYKTDGSVDKTLSDVVLEYNLRQENWFIHTNIPATQFAKSTSSSEADRLVFSSDDDAEVYQLFYGYNDNNNEIPINITTDNIYLEKNFENLSQVNKLLLEVKKGNGLKVFISLDDEDFYPLKATCRKGVNIIDINPINDLRKGVNCRTIKVSVREMSNSNCIVSRIALIYSPAGMATEHHK